jgi:23S rRNA (pseudouridine1915-N3)-methyltransferase
MQIVLYIISPIKSKELKYLILEFIKRAGAFAKVSLVEGVKFDNLEKIKSKYKNYLTIAMDEDGKEFTSRDFSLFFEKNLNQSQSQFLFVIGDADGFADTDLSLADYKMSLSKMTMPHEMAMLMLSEQVYRALTISNNHPYHRL